jgi:hypothetical protein
VQTYSVVGEPHQLTTDGQWVQNVKSVPGEFGFSTSVYVVPLPYLGEGRVQHIKRIREHLCVGLKEAKDLSDSLGLTFEGQVETRTVETLPAPMAAAFRDKINMALEQANQLKEAVALLSELLPTGDSQSYSSVANGLERAAQSATETYWALYDAQHAVAAKRWF